MPPARGVCGFFSKLRVEPILFLFILAYNASGSGTTTLFTQKICFPDRQPDVRTVCKEPGSLKTAAELSQTKTIVREVVSSVVGLLAGSWRDATRRSAPLIIMCHIGELIADTVELISSLYWNMSPWLTIMLDSVFGSLLGGRAVIIMACVAYITEKTTAEDRTIRLLIVLLMILGGTTLATLGGKLLISVGYTTFYIIILVALGVSLLLTILLVKDGEDRPSSNRGYLSSVKNLRIIFMSRPNSIAIWTLIFSTGVISALLTIEGSVSSLYLQSKFNLPPDRLGYIGTYKMVSSIFGAVFTIPLLKRVFKFSGFKTATICSIPSVASAIGMAFAADETQLYIFTTLDCLKITLMATLMTTFIGCLQKSEIGIYSSFLTLATGCLPLALGPLYLLIFYTTVESLPGAFYLFSAGLIVVSSVLTWIASCDYAHIKTEDNRKNIFEESSEVKTSK